MTDDGASSLPRAPPLDRNIGAGSQAFEKAQNRNGHYWKKVGMDWVWRHVGLPRRLGSAPRPVGVRALHAQAIGQLKECRCNGREL